MFEFFLGLGIIMLLAFIAAYFAEGFGYSKIIGYILVGMLIGPNISFNLMGYQYSGVITDKEIIRALSTFGLIFLLFFVGLEFRVDALKTAGKPAILLALTDLCINMFVGFCIGTMFGWPVADTLFLAAIIGMSSAAVATKSLIDLGKVKKPETHYLLSTMIVEDFMSILLLTVATTYVISGALEPVDVGKLIFGVVVIYIFFIFLALTIAPYTFHHFEKIRSEELFILFSLTIIFLASAFASFFGIPPAIGAFLIGMAFSENTVLREKLVTRMVSFRDAFVAIFFVSFGMLIDPNLFPQIAPMIVLAVPLIIINELFVLGSVAYLIGFTSRASLSIGSSLLGRGEDALLFASVGSTIKYPNTNTYVLSKRMEISSFAGLFCFIMSSITPFFMRMSYRFADILSSKMPHFIVFASSVFSRSLKRTIMEAGFKPTRREKVVLILIIFFAVMCGATLATSGVLHIFFACLAFIALITTYHNLKKHMSMKVRSIDFGEVSIGKFNPEDIGKFVACEITILFSMIFSVTVLWQYYWSIAVYAVIALLLIFILVMRWIEIKSEARPRISHRVGGTLEYRRKRYRKGVEVIRSIKGRGEIYYHPISKEKLLKRKMKRKK